jgi:hypothetical protein
MNYIKRLQAQVRALQQEKLALRNGLNELESYLLSPKFSCGNELDGYVNVNDVLNRLSDTYDAANDVSVSYGAIYKFLSE